MAHASGVRVEAEYTLSVQGPGRNTDTVIWFNINEAGGANTYGTVEGLVFTGPTGGLPRRDMDVSPMHRVLRASARAELLFGSDEVLIPALHMVGQYGISRRNDCAEVTYIHLAFDRHQVIPSDGAWTVSFLPGAQRRPSVD